MSGSAVNENVQVGGFARILNLYVWWLCLGVMTGFAQIPGARDTNFVTIAGSDAFPTSLAIAEDGSLFAGGTFINYGGGGHATVTHLLPNGSLDPAFSPVTFRSVIESRFLTNISIVTNITIVPGSTNRGTATGLALFRDGRVAVVGEFNDVNFERSTGFVTLTTQGQVAGTADPKLAGMEPRGAMSSFSGRVFIYGNQSLDPNPTNGTPGRLPIAEVDSSGGRVGSFVPPTLAELGLYAGFVTHMVSGPTNTVYAFVNAGRSNAPVGYSGYEILRLHESGTLDASFADGGRAEVSRIREPFARVSPQGELYISGGFAYRGASVPGPLRRIRLDGDIDTGFIPAIPNLGSPYVGVEPDGSLVMFGVALPEFMVRLRPDGSRDRSYQDPALNRTEATVVTENIRMGPDGSAYLMGTMIGFTGSQFSLDHGVIKVYGGQLKLGFTVQGSSLSLTWPPGFRLQRTPTLISPNWTDVPGATSPWPVPPALPLDFYRMVSQ